MYSFRVIVAAGQAPAVDELTGDIPPGVYQISGHDDPDAQGGAGQTHVLSIVRHDANGAAVVGASGYRGASLEGTSG